MKSLKDILTQEVEQGNISASNLHTINNYVRKLYTAKLKSQGYTFKDRLLDTHCIEVCKNILLDYSVQESINIATTEHSPNYDISVVKNYKWHRNTKVKDLVKIIINTESHHTIPKKYRRYNIFTLSKVDTPSQLFNNLKKEYDVSKEIEDLNRNLNVALDSKVDKKDLSCILYSQGGYTKKDLANKFHVSLSTMKRWLRES